MGCRICKHISSEKEIKISTFKDSSNIMTGNSRKQKLINSKLKISDIKPQIEKPKGTIISFKEFKELIPKDIIENEVKIENDFENSEKNPNHFIYDPIELSNGAIYYGEWNNNNLRMSGKGKMYLPKQNIYANGNWKDGNFYYGTIYSKDFIYHGDIANNTYNGYGTLKNKIENKTYEGNFKNGLKEGKGKLTFPDKSEYSGYFENDKISGEGEFYWANGDYYKGYFKNQIFHGEGDLKIKNGSKYKGQFFYGRFHGKGVFQWKNGDKYDGYYSYGKKEGYGEYTFKNGNVYKGEWFGNKPHGKGNFETKNNIYYISMRNGRIFETDKQKNEHEDFNFTFNWMIEDIDISKLRYLNVRVLNSSIFSLQNEEMKPMEEDVKSLSGNV
jgi:hypothetical protein